MGAVPPSFGRWVTTLRRELRHAAVPEKAGPMQAYMKSTLPYAGVPAPQLKALLRPLFAQLEFDDFETFDACVRHLFAHAQVREEKYAALQLVGARAQRRFATLAALPLYEWLIVEGAWWDLVDEVANHRLHPLLERDRAAMAKALRRWSKGDDLWLRRAAIIAQVQAHEATDLKLLFSVIEPALDEKEFFLRKGIGWALRAAAADFPREVRAYVEANRARLSGLSLREAEKGLTRAGA